MAMGKRVQRQESLFIMADGLPKSAGHPFYQKLNALLAEADFDRWIEQRCQQYYEHEEKRGQPSLPPGVYFRMLLVGYFEGIDSQPPPLKAQQKPKLSTATQRTLRADLRPRLRHRWHATELAEGSGERQQTLLDRRRGAQFRTNHAQTVRHRQAEDVAGPRRPCLSCTASARMALHV